MNEYLSNNFANNKDVLKKINVEGSELNIDFNPSKEFESLKKNKVQPKHLKPHEDPYQMYQLLHDKDIIKSPNLHLPKEAFRYSSSIVPREVYIVRKIKESTRPKC